MSIHKHVGKKNTPRVLGVVIFISYIQITQIYLYKLWVIQNICSDYQCPSVSLQIVQFKLKPS